MESKIRLVYCLTMTFKGNSIQVIRPPTIPKSLTEALLITTNTSDLIILVILSR